MGDAAPLLADASASIEVVREEASVTAPDLRSPGSTAGEKQSPSFGGSMLLSKPPQLSADVDSWDNEGVCEWLQVEGFGQIVHLFRGAEIIGVDLMHLGNNDLDQIGLSGSLKLRLELKRALHRLGARAQQEVRRTSNAQDRDAGTEVSPSSFDDHDCAIH